MMKSLKTAIIASFLGTVGAFVPISIRKIISTPPRSLHILNAVRNLEPSDLSVLFIVAEDNDKLESDRRLPHVRFGELAEKAKSAERVGIECCKLFVYQNTKTRNGDQGLDDGNLMTRAIRTIKEAAPQLKVMPEVCACAYTSNGECVMVDQNGEIDDAATHEYVGKMAVLQAKAGADILVAGLTHKGSVAAMRKALDKEGYDDRGIMASIQFRSAFYGPYRKMMNTEPTSGFRIRSQIESGNWEQTIGWVREFDENASEFTLQPVMANTDALAKIRNFTKKRLTAYSVSTEMGIICDKTLVWNDKNAQVLREYYENLLRTGADKIMSYVAIEMAEWLLEKKAESNDSIRAKEEMTSTSEVLF